MRMLVLGAGALGGYFGGRLIEAGGDVTFLVRPARAAALAAGGLRIESAFGEARMPVRTVTAEALAPEFDVILLGCKAFDLEEAIMAIRPAMGERTVVLPVLNGLAHIATLSAAFGPERVLGGLCKIQATLSPEGVVRHLNDWRWITFGEQDGRITPRVQAIADAYQGAKGVVAEAVPDIGQRMWEKFVHLGTAALGTVLMRANVGEIVRGGGAPFMAEVLRRNAAIAAHHGHPMPESFLREYGALFSDPASAYSTSLLRDVEGGRRTEGEHILGHLLEAARAAGVESAWHEAAALHIRAHEARRQAGRLP